MRFLGCGFVALLTAGLLAGSAWSNHDPKALFSGRWDLDPNGTPGKLSLTLVSAFDGVNAFKKLVVVGPDDSCRGPEPVQWYEGSFTTPTDSGPVVGCSEKKIYRDFSGFFKSEKFDGKVGKLNIPTPPKAGVLFHAQASQAGDYSPPFAYFEVPIRFAGHFVGDGATLEKRIRRGIITVSYVNRQFSLGQFETVHGASLRICNTEGVFRNPFSFPKTGPNAFKVILKPGACFTKKLVNTTRAPIVVRVFDTHLSQAKPVVVVIHPRGA